MKKVGIVTVQNSMNYGAYLQAYALSRFCKENGQDTYFIKTNARHPYIDTLKQIIKSILKGKFSRVGYYLTLLKKYKEAWKYFKLISKDKISEEDICITGSDEIWNISREAFLKFPVFYGSGLNTKHIIAYAPSCNITPIEKFRENPNVMESLKNYERIAVRDYHTQEVISQIIEKKVEIVLDPTLLIDKKYYLEAEKEMKQSDKYLLIYGDDNFTDKQKKEIKETAKERKLKLVAAGLYLDWCDENLPCSPMEFLGLIHKAEYVITTTFHGSVFSSIYQKQFAVYPGKKQKVLDFLKAWDLQDRNMNTQNKLSRVLDLKIDYEKFNNKLKAEKAKSQKYLLTILEK